MFSFFNFSIFLLVSISGNSVITRAQENGSINQGKQSLFSKLIDLESRFEAYSTRIDELEKQLENFQDFDKRIVALEEKSLSPWRDYKNNDDNLEERVTKLEDIANAPGILRSCYEYLQYGVSISGDFMIDPDGVNMGHPPMKVFCDFVTGATEVYHDNEEEIIVEHCPDPGCFQSEVTYKNGLNGTAISMSQIEALINLSNQCTQDFYYDCTLAPLHSVNIDMVYWQDRHGMDGNNYFTGSNFGFHVCACHYTEEGCTNEQVMGNTCSCDANLPVPERDTGTISNNTALPITKMSLGGLAYETQRSSFHLGRLKCFGKDNVKDVDSCGALKKLGEMRSGFYNIMKLNDEATSLVYCNMSSGGYDDLIQTDTDSLASLPLGSIVSWVPKTVKTYAQDVSIPDGWQLCDGSPITKGVWNGLMTPNLNNEKRFLRGSNVDDVLTMEEDMILDHQHTDGTHTHVDTGHAHSYTNYGQSGDHHCGTGGSKCAPDGTSTLSSVTAAATLTSVTSNIGKIDEEVSPGRKGEEVRPKNMHVSFIIRIY